MAIDFMELLGAMSQGGVSASAGRRAQSVASSMGGVGGLQNLLGGLLSGGQSMVNRAGRAVGGNDNLAAAGMGALIGALSGRSNSSAMGGLGGGLMGLLGMMAFKALSNAGQKAQMPYGLADAQAGAQAAAPTADDAKLIITAMVDAAKADGQVDQEELNRITGRIKETGIGQEGINYIIAQLQAPMATAAIVQAVRGRPEMAAQVYSASLMAIEVDTAAERRYLDDLANAMGLPPQVAQNIEQLMGMPQTC